MLVGDIAKSLIGDLKKAAPKATYATGVCTVKDNEIMFEREVGKLQPRLVSAALKLSGIKSVVKFHGEEDEAEAENEQEDAPSVEHPKPNGPVAKTVPVENKAPQQSVPKPPVTAPSGQISPLAKDFQEKLKKLRPSFDDALKKAKAQTKGTWADDLDSNFAQMVQEAKAGQFEKAMLTLARLARMVKSEEAARAEVKHQSMKEDEHYAEATSERMDKQLSKQDVKEIRKGNKQSGFGLTEDGNMTYALPVKPAEWKSKVLDGLDKLGKMLKDDPVDVSDVTTVSDQITQLINQLSAHAQESDEQFPERDDAIEAVQGTLAEYQQEFLKLSFTQVNVKPPAAFVDECAELRKQIQTLLGNPRKAPDGKATEEFKKQAQKRKEARDAALRKRGVALKMLEKEIDELRTQLKEFDGAEDERQELAGELNAKIEALTVGTEVLRDDVLAHSKGITENAEREEFERGDRQPDKVVTMFSAINVAKALAEKGQFEQAQDTIGSLTSDLLGQGFAQGDDKEREVFNALQSLQEQLMIAAQVKSYSPPKAARLVRRLKAEAQKVTPLLE